MEKSKKNLKELSIVVLVFAALTLVRLIADTVTLLFSKDFVKESIGDISASDSLINASIILVLGLGILFLIPQIYVGLKGLQAANSDTPSASKAYIVWAKVLFVFSIIAIVGSVSGIFDGSIAVSDILAIVDSAIDVVLFFLFIKSAKAVEA